MKHYLLILSFFTISIGAQAERTFEQKKFLLQSTTVVSSLIYSGRVIAESTLGADSKCRVLNNSVDTQENPPKYEVLFEVGGSGCSLYYKGHFLSGHIKVLLKVGLNSKVMQLKTAEAEGEMQSSGPSVHKFLGTGLYSEGNSIANVIETQSEMITSEQNPYAVTDLSYRSKVVVGSDSAEVILSSHKTPDGKTTTDAKIDGVTIPQSDLEIMFPNTYKKTF